MSDYIFEIIDKSERKIRLTKKQWRHITKSHKYMANYLEKIKETLIKPQKITISPYDKEVRYYYQYLKDLPDKNKYLLIAVRYLNEGGFVITSYLVRNIK